MSFKKAVTTVMFSAIVTWMGMVFAVPSVAQAAKCDKYSGRNYIICKESGPQHMPHGLPAGTPHPGSSSASGPCGFLAKTRMKYGVGTLKHCERYMRDRYGSWSAAEAHHRAKNWW